jgi:hypothetical protein
MKTKKLGLLVVTAIMLGALLYSCSKEEINPAAQNTKSQLNLKGGNAEFYWADPVCAGSAADFCITIQPRFNNQGKPLSQEYGIQLYDEATGTYNNILQGSSGESTPVTKCVSHTFDSPGTYYVRYKIGSGGYSSDFAVTVNNCGCSEDFSYIDNGDETYTFTYLPAEDMSNALVVFTFAQSDRVDVSGDVSVANGWTINGQTYQKTMNFTKCVPVSWTVGLSPKCSGHGGQSNLWTDFKVNDISKKNANTPNIVATCPGN